MNDVLKCQDLDSSKDVRDKIIVVSSSSTSRAQLN